MKIGWEIPKEIEKENIAEKEEVEAVKDLKEAEVRIEKNIIHLGDIEAIIKNIGAIEIEEEVAHRHLVLHHPQVHHHQMTLANKGRREKLKRSLKFQSKISLILTISVIGMYILIFREEKDRSLKKKTQNSFGMVSNGLQELNQSLMLPRMPLIRQQRLWLEKTSNKMKIELPPLEQSLLKI